MRLALCSLAEPVIGPAKGRTRWLGPRNDGMNRQSHSISHLAQAPCREKPIAGSRFPDRPSAIRPAPIG
jgi:hypothetical protein